MPLAAQGKATKRAFLVVLSPEQRFSPEQSVASLWKIPWVRRQRARLRRPLHILLAPIVVNYIKLVVNTSTIVADPPDYEDRGRNLHPCIIGLWHGQFFLLPAIYPRDVPGRAIVARHEDAEALARILRSFGLELVRGAGAAGRSSGRDRGGTEAAHGLIASLREGFSVALTADVPPGPARKAGPGIVMISSRSGRPIVPFAVASSRYWSAKSWSRMTINLPFSKIGIAMGPPIYVPSDIRAEDFKRYQKQVEAAFNEVTARAYALAGADMTRATPPEWAARGGQSQSYYDQFK